MTVSQRPTEVWGFQLTYNRAGRCNWPDALKSQIAQKVLIDGVRVDTIATEIGANRELVSRWVRKVQSPQKRKPSKTSFVQVIPMPDAKNTRINTKATSIIQIRYGDIEVDLPDNYPIRQIIQLVEAFRGLK